MSSTTLAIRLPTDIKDYLLEMDVSPRQVVTDLVIGLRDGSIGYDGKGFTIKNNSEGCNTSTTEEKTHDLEDVMDKAFKAGDETMPAFKDLDASELYAIAKRRRITPQSLLDNALRPYRH